jgi:hypothetical protein
LALVAQVQRHLPEASALEELVEVAVVRQVRLKVVEGEPVVVQIRLIIVEVPQQVEQGQVAHSQE